MTLADAHVTRLPATKRLVPPFPTPPSRPLSALEFVRALRVNPLLIFTQETYDADIVEGRVLGRSNFTVSTPSAIRHVLVDNTENYQRTRASIRVLRPLLGEGLLLAEGTPWRHQRRTLAPAFTPKAVDLLVPHILSATNESLAGLSAGDAVDLAAAMQTLALEIAGRTMFSLEMSEQGPKLRDLLAYYALNFAQPHFLDIVLPLAWPSPRDLRRRFFRRRWTRFLSELMQIRRAGATHTGLPRDLFDLMLAARDPETGEGFTAEQLGDEVATMILAGHETTAVALFWSLYCLALDPLAQERLADEARQAAANGEPALQQLPFTRAVIDEAMRLYPPAFMIIRAAKGPDTIEGRKVARGDVVAVSPWILHRHNRLWREPSAFMPERFLSGAAPIDRFAYLPFGVGPRVCIGAHFALTEATLALAKLIGTFRISLPGNDRIMPVGVVTTRPDRQPAFRLERR